MSIDPRITDQTIAANTARCLPEAERRATLGEFSLDQWQAVVLMTCTLMHAAYDPSDPAADPTDPKKDR